MINYLTQNEAHFKFNYWLCKLRILSSSKLSRAGSIFIDLLSSNTNIDKIESGVLKRCLKNKNQKQCIVRKSIIFSESFVASSINKNGCRI